MDLQFCRSNSHWLSRRAKKIAADVLGIQTERKDYVNFSSRAPPVGIGAKDEQEFESRKSKEEERMGTVKRKWLQECADRVTVGWIPEFERSLPGWL
ncbi:uncharacterized protein LOC129889722 isoform X2 [Solanum dulcamara]|uniref:uncharacterized protein LOC129889722 isoform X2 n=1 Tax=Solanum dulcamara TaxID=45834 RepID=UPI00248602A4|nr:uncharacterized protein LOC129889722 isoform X2 [Solanum dulcamara]XP_055821107.1 uncharacterized protein LOC129889722 isoform X2 [Solanum dulcamara]